MSVEPEQFLHPDRKFWALLGFVIDRDGGARRRGEMRRRFGVEPAPQIPGQQVVKSRRHLVRAEIGKRGLADERWRQPVASRGGKRGIGNVRPLLSFGTPK